MSIELFNPVLHQVVVHGSIYSPGPADVVAQTLAESRGHGVEEEEATQDIRELLQDDPVS